MLSQIYLFEVFDSHILVDPSLEHRQTQGMKREDNLISKTFF